MNSLQSALSNQPWFKTWFDTSYYHSLYRNRNDEEAGRFIDAILDRFCPSPGAAMLDLGCGSGRHSKHLASKGFNVTGIDLSFSSIKEARKWEKQNLSFFQHDMRLPFGSRRFDFIFNLFTSFGYFKDQHENNKVVGHVSEALCKNGIAVFDYLNVPYAEAHLVAVEEKEIDGVWYHINRWTDKDFIYKRIAIQDGQLPTPLEYVEQVAKFSLAHFNEFFRHNKLKTVGVFGNYDLEPYDMERSGRMIVVATKNA